AELNLFYNNVKKFETTATGTTTTGISYISGSGLNINSNTVDSLITLNRTTGIWSIDNDSSYYLNFKATSLGTTNLTLKSTGEVVIPDYGSGNNTGTAAYNLEVDSSGNIIETASSGGGGGTFHGSGTFTAAAVATPLFTLTRANTATLVFDVWLTSGDSSAESICKRYTVARAHAVTAPPYNKLIDSGPDGSNDFAVTFVGDATTGVACKIAASGANQTVSYTVQVGYDSVNTVTIA
ncbi:MAG: hypothetical protein H8E55_64460, partial [Pelagibacterales bacterium]|nr:hypothetical protein [Pelagibacterales bacterium]